MTTTTPTTAALDPELPYTGSDRMIDLVWVVGERMTVGYKPEPREVIAVLQIRHNRGGYTASLEREERTDNRRCVIIGGPHYVRGVNVLSEPCGRFSAKRFDEFAASALAQLRTMTDDAGVQALFAPPEAE